MIARIWHGRTAEVHADAYLGYLRETGIKSYRATAGNQGVFVLRRIEGGEADFLLLSLWDSFDAVRAFAGPQPEKAVYYPKDDDYILEREPGVRHYEVVVEK